MRPLRILHTITHSQVTRGGAIQALLLARGQQQQGHLVEVVCNSRASKPLHKSFQPWTAEGLLVLPFDMHKKRELLRYRRLLAANRPDVVHVHRDAALLFTFFATAFANPPAFISQRGTTHPFRSRTIAFCHRSRRVHRIIAVAHAVKEALVSYGVAPDRIEVVYGSFNVDRFDPARADRRALRDELGLAEQDPLIVQVGELHRKKAPVAFVETAALMLKERSGLTFALVGKGKLQEDCERRIAELGVGERVRMLGFRTDIPSVYAAADIAVNSSTGYEGLTGALREALAMAKPVAATRVDGNPEVVRDGETGLLVAPRDPEAMARAIGTLLDHPQRAREFGQAGRKLILETMHPSVRLARAEEVYRSVLEQRHAAATA
ncbi:MAG: glycosyltransferase family 4 protein [Planctomycetota bacterium]